MRWNLNIDFYCFRIINFECEHRRCQCKVCTLRLRIVCDHVALNQLEFACLVHFFCSNWTKLAYSKSLNMDQTCVFDENLSRDQKFRRESQWTKLVTACICCHVMEEVVDQTWDPRVI